MKESNKYKIRPVVPPYNYIVVVNLIISKLLVAAAFCVTEIILFQQCCQDFIR